MKFVVWGAIRQSNFHNPKRQRGWAANDFASVTLRVVLLESPIPC